MGVFDYIRCDFPLPDGFAGGVKFQTKDTPAQYLETYIITSDGRLLDEHGRDTQFHGDIAFYWSNVTGSWGELISTEGDAPPDGRDYLARFTDGRLARITDVTERWWSERKHVTSTEMRRRHEAE
jgi:hypothetical protein